MKSSFLFAALALLLPFQNFAFAQENAKPAYLVEIPRIITGEYRTLVDADERSISCDEDFIPKHIGVNKNIDPKGRNISALFLSCTDAGHDNEVIYKFVGYRDERTKKRLDYQDKPLVKAKNQSKPKAKQPELVSPEKTEAGVAKVDCPDCDRKKSIEKIMREMGKAPLCEGDPQDQYFSNFRKRSKDKNNPDSEFENYIREYKKEIETASSITGVPKNFLACSLFVETQFQNASPNAVCDVTREVGKKKITQKEACGAAGIAQFTGNTTPFMSQLISKNKDVQQRCQPHDVECMAILDIGRKLNDFSAQWVKYHHEMNEAVPDKFTWNKEARNPSQSIMASAIYFEYMMYNFDPELMYINSTKDREDFFVALSGGSNGGPGLLKKVIAEGGTPKDWVQVLPERVGAYFHRTDKIAENRAHMMSIRNCMGGKKESAGMVRGKISKLNDQKGTFIRKQIANVYVYEKDKYGKMKKVEKQETVYYTPFRGLLCSKDINILQQTLDLDDEEKTILLSRNSQAPCTIYGHEKAANTFYVSDKPNDDEPGFCHAN